MWGNSSCTTCGYLDSAVVLLGSHSFSAPISLLWLVRRWGISKGSRRAEIKPPLYRSHTYLRWLGSSKALHRWAVSMDNSSWMLCENSEVLTWETRNPHRHVFFMEIQLLKRGNGGEAFCLCARWHHILLFPRKREGSGEHRYRTEECCWALKPKLGFDCLISRLASDKHGNCS